MWGGRAVEGCVGVWGDGVMEACDSMLWGPRPCTPIRSQTGLPAGQDTAQCGGGSSGTQEPTAEPYVISFGGKGHPGSPTSHIVLLPGPSCHLRLRRPQTPPPPPKRPETWECAGPSTGEESDEGDTYEVPPCESQARKVAPAKRQEDADSTYLDHAAARRCSESYTQLPAQFLSKVSLGPGTDAGNGEEMPWGQAWRKALDRSRAQLPQAPCSRRGSLPSAGRTPPPQPAGPAAPQNPGLASWNKLPAGRPWPRGACSARCPRCGPRRYPSRRSSCLGRSRSWLMPPLGPGAKAWPAQGAVEPPRRIRTRPGMRGAVTGRRQRASCRGSTRMARSWCVRARARAGASRSPWPCCTEATSTTSPSATWRAAASTRWARTARATSSGSPAWPPWCSTTRSTRWC
ncbi:SH2 domain-containing protein 6 isoform X4 [Pelodiscus sinensis]|uniref:SH2 domain-containing protein 6 isoform X4 n=1 Tax=Pelodiscus sinensis TaxID=13735 RepID=UPI003F6AF76F